MPRLPAALALLSLAATPLAAQSQAAEAEASKPLGAEIRSDLTCAAAFAIVASEQQRGVASALAFPPLAHRGKEFFVRAGARATEESGLDRDAVRALLEAEVARLQREAAGSGGPDGTVAQVMSGCLPRLDAVIAQLAKPGLAQCAAIMQLAYEEVHASEGLSPRARDLKILASVLEAREREALTAKGLSGQDVDRTVIEARDRMRAESAAADGVEKYDLQVCYELAKPDEAKHY